MKYPLGAIYCNSHDKCCGVDSVECCGQESDCGGLKNKWEAEKNRCSRLNRWTEEKCDTFLFLKNGDALGFSQMEQDGKSLGNTCGVESRRWSLILGKAGEVEFGARVRRSLPPSEARACGVEGKQVALVALESRR